MNTLPFQYAPRRAIILYMGFLSLLAWAIFLGATGLSIALGVILGFHWKNYSVNPQTFYIASAVYSIGALSLLALLLGSVLSYT